MSLYEGLCSQAQQLLTQELVDIHPIELNVINDTVLECWQEILGGGFLNYSFLDIGLDPQTIGGMIHKIIPVLLRDKLGSKWSVDTEKQHKDVVNSENDQFSFEIKTSSSKGDIYANRSFAKSADSPRKVKKVREGYYLAINFEKFSIIKTEGRLPQITKIAFGFLEQSDWTPQNSPHGQSASLGRKMYTDKFVTTYKVANGAQLSLI